MTPRIHDRPSRRLEGCTARRPSGWAAVAAIWMLIGASLTFAGAPEPVSVRAVFFDLGDTLVYRDHDGQVRLFEDARQTIVDLKARGIRVGVITNVPEGYTRAQLEEFIAAPGFLDLFEVVVLSSEAPAPKPDPRIFTHALGLMDDPPPADSVAFVAETPEHMGDTAENPTSGARALGWVGILKAGAPDPRADMVVPDLATLARRLQPPE